jgi:hypothetical protein
VFLQGEDPVDVEKGQTFLAEEYIVLEHGPVKGIVPTRVGNRVLGARGMEGGHPAILEAVFLCSSDTIAIECPTAGLIELGYCICPEFAALPHW